MKLDVDDDVRGVRLLKSFPSSPDTPDCRRGWYLGSARLKRAGVSESGDSGEMLLFAPGNLARTAPQVMLAPPGY